MVEPGPGASPPPPPELEAEVQRIGREQNVEHRAAADMDDRRSVECQERLVDQRRQERMQVEQNPEPKRIVCPERVGRLSRDAPLVWTEVREGFSHG